jgi:hypothetical protein
MNAVLIVNHSEKNCGVQSYGSRVAQIFKASKKYNVVYCEPGSASNLLNIIDGLRPSIVIYNYLAQTMPWLTHPAIKGIRQIGIKQGLIVHNMGYAEIFDFYLHQNPNHPGRGPGYPLLRPLFDYHPDRMNYEGHGSVIRIGTFGFALPEKNYPRICDLVNQQFKEAEIRMHLTAAHFRPDQGWMNQIASESSRAITKPGIKLSITSDFRDDNAILDFLSENDLNIFLYQNFPHYNGLSSVVDYALSVPRPIAVCRSGLFAHISDAEPPICVEEASLQQIINNGIEPTRQFRKEWSNANFVRHLEGVLDSL